MENYGTSPPSATIAADHGLFIYLGEWRRTELERLKRGTGNWMRRIEAAMESWREDRSATAASIVAVVVLYRCHRLDCIRFDAPESSGVKGSLRSRFGPPIVVELGEVEGSQVDELLHGHGKVLEETREAVRLVQMNVTDEGTARIFVPIIATYFAAQRPHQSIYYPRRPDGGASGDAGKTPTIRYFRASRARIGRNRITFRD